MFTKYQIALQYSPELVNNPALAVRRLRIMTNRCKDLKLGLERTGYKNYCKTFTPQQVKLIYHFLGDPPVPCKRTSLFEKYVGEELQVYDLINKK